MRAPSFAFFALAYWNWKEESELLSVTKLWSDMTSPLPVTVAMQASRDEDRVALDVVTLLGDDREKLEELAMA